MSLNRVLKGPIAGGRLYRHVVNLDPLVASVYYGEEAYTRGKVGQLVSAMVGWNYTLGPIFPESSRMVSYSDAALLAVF